MNHSRTNLEIQSQGLTQEEKEALIKAIRKINFKRKRDNMPRLLYKIKFG